VSSAKYWYFKADEYELFGLKMKALQSFRTVTADRFKCHDIQEKTFSFCPCSVQNL